MQPESLYAKFINLLKFMFRFHQKIYYLSYTSMIHFINSVNLKTQITQIKNYSQYIS